MLSVRFPPAELNISAFPPVLRDWVIKGLGMSSLVYATGHIKDPVPLIAKRRGLCPGGRFPPSFIHQVIIITGQNKLYNCMFLPPPECIPCNCLLTIKHLLIECVDINDVHQRFYQVPSLQDLFKAVKPEVILEFLKAAALYRLL